MDTESKAKTEDVKVEVEKPALPTKIKLTKMWGFIDKKGVDHLWQAGQVVDDPAEIKMIVVDCKFEFWTEVK